MLCLCCRVLLTLLLCEAVLLCLNGEWNELLCEAIFFTNEDQGILFFRSYIVSAILKFRIILLITEWTALSYSSFIHLLFQVRSYIIFLYLFDAQDLVAVTRASYAVIIKSSSLRLCNCMYKRTQKLLIYHGVTAISEPPSLYIYLRALFCSEWPVNCLTRGIE